MKQFYIGVKIVEAWPEEKNGEQGYSVKYEDGYVSWSPKEVFESAYLPMGEENNNRVTHEMVENFIGEQCNVSDLDEKTTLVKCETLTGFRQYEVSSCVDPSNYDREVGREICLERIKNTIWKCLGFVVQWGRFGLTKK